MKSHYRKKELGTIFVGSKPCKESVNLESKRLTTNVTAWPVDKTDQNIKARKDKTATFGAVDAVTKMLWNESSCCNINGSTWNDSIGRDEDDAKLIASFENLGIASSSYRRGQNTKSVKPLAPPDDEMKIKCLTFNPYSIMPARTNPLVWVTGNRNECDYLVQTYFLSNHKLRLISLDIEGSICRRVDRLVPSVIQIGTFHVCVIIQIYRMIVHELDQRKFFGTETIYNNEIRSIPIPIKLSQLLEEKSVYKIGFGITADVQLLKQHFSGVTVSNYFDLADLSSSLSIPPGLAKFTNLFATEKVYKTKNSINKYKAWEEHKKRNWDKKKLTEEEIFYASRDIFAVLFAFRQFIRGGNSSLCNFQSSNIFNRILSTEIEEKRVGLDKLNYDNMFLGTDEDSEDTLEVDALEYFQRGQVFFVE